MLRMLVWPLIKELRYHLPWDVRDLCHSYSKACRMQGKILHLPQEDPTSSSLEGILLTTASTTLQSNYPPIKKLSLIWKYFLKLQKEGERERPCEEVRKNKSRQDSGWWSKLWETSHNGAIWSSAMWLQSRITNHSTPKMSDCFGVENKKRKITDSFSPQYAMKK